MRFDLALNWHKYIRYSFPGRFANDFVLDDWNSVNIEPLRLQKKKLSTNLATFTLLIKQASVNRNLKSIWKLLKALKLA